MDIISPKGFLQVGGIVLVLVAILGFIGIIGPTEGALFGAGWWFDNAENWAHLVLGVVALAVAYGVKDAKTQKTVTMVVGVVAILVGLYGFINPMLLGANLEFADNILHLVIGAWALKASMKKPMMVSNTSGPMPV